MRKERREKKGDKHRNPSRNQEEPANHDGTEPLSLEKKEKRRRETSTGTPARTRRNQQIMMEQNPFPEERKKREEGRQAPEPKKREEGRQAPEPQPEPGGTSKSWWNRTPVLKKERREKKGDKHRNQRRENKGDKHRNPRNQRIMMEQNPFPEERKKREEGRQAPEPKKREEGRQAPEPQPEPRGTSKAWWNRTPFLRKERREKKGDKHRKPSQNQEEPANHDGTEPLSWRKKEERRRQTSTGTKEERRRETSTGTPAGTTRNQQIMMEQNPFPEERREKKGDKHWNPSRNQEEPANHDGTEPLSWGKKEERRRETSTGSKEEKEGRQAPKPQPEPGGTSKSWWNRTPFLRKERREKKGDKHQNQRKEKKGDKHRNPSRNQEEPAKHDGTEPLSWGQKEERTRETSTGTPAGTKRNQQIMEQNPFPEERKKREEGRQAPEPQPEPGGTSKSWWNRTAFLGKERREKKGDKHRNPSRNQEEPANHDGTEPLSWGKKEERRRETSTGTPAGTRRNQQIMMEQKPCPEESKMGEEGRQAPEPKKREEGRQAPEPQPEPRGTSKSWWNRTPVLRKARREKKGDKHRNQRREKKGDKHRNPSRNQEEPANHDGTEPLILRKERREKKGDKHRNPSRKQEEPANHEGTKAVSSKNWEPHSAQELFRELKMIQVYMNMGKDYTSDRLSFHKLLDWHTAAQRHRVAEWWSPTLWARSNSLALLVLCQASPAHGIVIEQSSRISSKGHPKCQALELSTFQSPMLIPTVTACPPCRANVWERCTLSSACFPKPEVESRLGHPCALGPPAPQDQRWQPWQLCANQLPRVWIKRHRCRELSC